MEAVEERDIPSAFSAYTNRKVFIGPVTNAIEKARAASSHRRGRRSAGTRPSTAGRVVASSGSAADRSRW
jgi:hypothetical protein